MAAYTQLTDQQIHTLLSAYDIGEVTRISPQDGGQANTSYRIKTENGGFMLSVCDEKTMEEARILILVLETLNRHGFPTSQPIATRQGETLQDFEGKPVYLKAFIPGEVTRDLSAPMVEDVGLAMARLHAIPPVKGISPRFPYGKTAFDAYLDKPIAHEFTAWLTEQRKWLEAHLDTGMAQGLIHGDIFWDNLVFEGESLKAVLDFEEACTYYRLFDLGMAAVGCCSDEGKFNPQLLGALIRGYETQIPLTETERNQLPVFLVYGATAGAFWRFCQYNIHHPHPRLKESYKALAGLADQVRSKDPSLNI